MKKLIFVLVSLFVALPAAASFDNDLYYGIKGNSDVMALQEFMTEQSIYTGPITGNFYSLTLAAVKEFQTQQEITPVSGYFGPLTRIKANAVLSSQMTDELGASFTPTTTAPAATTDDVLVKLNEQIQLLMSQIASLQAIQATQQSQSVALEQIQENTTPAPEPAAPVVVVPEVVTPIEFENVDCRRNMNGPYCTLQILTTANEITISSDSSGYFIGSNCSNGEWANYDGSQRKGNPLTCSAKFFQYRTSATGTINFIVSAGNNSSTTSVFIPDF